MHKKSVLILLAAIFFLKINSTAQGIKLLAADESCLYAVKDSGLFQVTNYGKDFKLIRAGTIEQLAVNGASIFIYSGGSVDERGYFVSTNHGVDWKEVYGMYLKGGNSIAIAIYGNELFATCVKKTFVSTDNGKMWNEIESLPGSVVFAGAVGSKIFVSSSKGLYFSDGDRNKWQKCQGLNAEIFKERKGGVMGVIGVSNVVSDGNLYYAGVKAYGNWGGVYVSDDKGLTWKRRGYRVRDWKGFDDLLFAYDIESLVLLNQTLFAESSRGSLYISNNQGNMWTRSDMGLVGGSINALAVLGKDVYALESVLFVSHNRGASWVKAQASSAIVSKKDPINFENKDKEYVLAFEDRLKLDSAIFLECQFFKNFPPGLAYLGPYTSNGSMVIAGTTEVGYGMYKTLDGGTTWSKVNKGYKLAGYQTPDATFVFGSGNRIFVGTSMQGLFYSDNYGESWTDNKDKLPKGGVAGFDNFLSMESMFITDTALHLVMENIEGDFVSVDNGKSWKHSGGRTMEDINAEIHKNVVAHNYRMSQDRAATKEIRNAEYRKKHPINYSTIPRSSSGPDYKGMSEDRFKEQHNHRDSWISSQGVIHTN